MSGAGMGRTQGKSFSDHHRRLLAVAQVGHLEIRQRQKRIERATTRMARATLLVECDSAIGWYSASCREESRTGFETHRPTRPLGSLCGRISRPRWRCSVWSIVAKNCSSTMRWFCGIYWRWMTMSSVRGSLSYCTPSQVVTPSSTRSRRLAPSLIASGDGP